MQLFSSDVRRVLSNTASQLSVRVLTSITTLLVTLIISYYMGLSSYGSFTKIVAFVTFFYLFVDFGMNAVFLREYYQETKHYASMLIGSRLLTSIALVVVINITALFLPYNEVLGTGYSQEEKLLILLFSFTIVLYGLQLSLQALMQRYLEYNKQILPTVVFSTLLLGIVWYGAVRSDLQIIFIGYLVATMVYVGLLFGVLRQHLITSFSMGTLMPFVKRLLVLSTPLALVLIFNLVYAKIDIILLSIYSSSFDVGVYGFSYRIFELAIAVPLLFSNSVYPYLLEHSSNRAKFISLIRQYSTMLFGGSLLIGVLLFVGAPVIGFLQADFEASILPLRILLVSLPFFFLTSLFQWILIVKNSMKALIGIYFTVMVIVVALNVIFIPQYSYYAAAIITVVGEGLVLVLLTGYLLTQRAKFFGN